MASNADWEWDGSGWGDSGWGDEQPTAMFPARAEAQVTTTAITKAPTKASRNKRVVQPWQTCSKKDIKPYQKYKVLFGERKFAQEFAKQKQTLSFTDDLPTEVRLRIYDFLFSTPGGYFEFWAPEEKTIGDDKWQNLFRSYIPNTKALRIMRLSKKIREEVADYFYRRLNMRFSGWTGFLVMALFNHSIRPWNCSFITHITVKFPHDIVSNAFMKRWDRFISVQKSRGMRIPYIRGREMERSRGTTNAECYYDLTVFRGFRQLSNMAGLKLLEILVPWDYVALNSQLRGENGEYTDVPCDCEAFPNLSPKDQVRHLFEGHNCDSEYWTLLADLKQYNSSDDLTIALVYDYTSAREGYTYDCYFDMGDVVCDNLRRGRWVAAYASVMGYKFGYARYAENGAYKVRYDEDTLMAESLELLKAGSARPVAYDPLLEPPELSG